MDTMTNTPAAVAADFARAKKDIAADMASRDIGAIIWDNSTAGFTQIPEIVHVSTDNGHTRVARITGLYLYDGQVFLIEEDRSGVNIDDFYNHDTEVRPTVVTLTPDMAVRELGNPNAHTGYTLQGSLEEWLVIADCYFEALTER